METIRIISLVLLYLSMGLNLYACALNMRGFHRNKKLSKLLEEQLEFWQEENKKYKENENDERKNEYPPSTGGTENA